MKIQVTQEDITAALNARPHADMVECCPIAQALIRLFPGEPVFVSSRFLKVGWAWYGLYMGNPALEVMALKRDQWRRVRPFSFEATEVVP